MQNQLMNATVATSLPPLYSQEEKGDAALAMVKYFCLTSEWTWYATEYDPVAKTFFGLVHGFEVELGYFTLAEFEELNASSVFPVIERDLYWVPKSLADVRREIEERGSGRQ